MKRKYQSQYTRRVSGTFKRLESQINQKSWEQVSQTVRVMVFSATFNNILNYSPEDSSVTENSRENNVALL